MMEFEKHPSILESVEAKKVIRMYNKLSKVLVEYETLYYRCWLEQVWKFNFNFNYISLKLFVWVEIQNHDRVMIFKCKTIAGIDNLNT